MRAKYLVTEVRAEFTVYPVAVCFPEYIGHADMARKLGVEPEKVSSAGFFTLSTDRFGDISVDAFGESVGLSKRADKDDYKLIRKSLGLDPT